MALTKLENDLAIIQKLDNEPNDVGGMSAEQLKAKFDEAAETIQKYINEVLLAELERNTAASELGAVLDGEAVSIQTVLDTLKAAGVQSGNVPTGGSKGDYLRKKSSALYDMEWATLIRTVNFSESSWTENEDGTYGMVLEQSAHAREGEDFMYSLWHSVDGALVSNTWATASTRCSYDNASARVTLTAEVPYGGTIVFCG